MQFDKINSVTFSQIRLPKCKHVILTVNPERITTAIGFRIMLDIPTKYTITNEDSLTLEITIDKVIFKYNVDASSRYKNHKYTCFNIYDSILTNSKFYYYLLNNNIKLELYCDNRYIQINKIKSQLMLENYPKTRPGNVIKHNHYKYQMVEGNFIRL